MEVFEGGENAAEGAGAFFGVDEFLVETVRSRRVFETGGGDKELWAGPVQAVEQVFEDGLTFEAEVGFGFAHARTPAAGEDREGDLFARWHDWGV